MKIRNPLLDTSLAQTPGGIMNDFTNRMGNPSDEQLKKESFSSIGKKMRSTAATIGQNKQFLPQSNEQNNSIYGTTSGLERSGSSD